MVSLQIDLKTLINVRVYVNSKNDDAVASHSMKETAYKSASGNKVASNPNGELNHVMKDIATPSSGTAKYHVILVLEQNGSKQRVITFYFYLQK